MDCRELAEHARSSAQPDPPDAAAFREGQRLWLRQPCRVVGCVWTLCGFPRDHERADFVGKSQRDSNIQQCLSAAAATHTAPSSEFGVGFPRLHSHLGFCLWCARLRVVLSLGGFCAQVSAEEALDGKHVAYYFSSQAVEDQLEKAAQGQEAVRPTPVVKEVNGASLRLGCPWLFGVCARVSVFILFRRTAVSVAPTR